MNIAVIQSETRFIGGVERITENLLQYGRSTDMNLYAVFLRSGPMVDRVRQFFPPERILVVEAGRYRQFGKTLRTVVRLARQFKRWNIDATLSQGFHAQCYGGPAAFMAGAKNIFWCHALLRADKERKDFVVRAAMRMPTTAVVGYPQSNLANLEAGFPTVPVHLVYPSERLETFANADCEIVRREFNIPRATPIVTMIGRVQPWKGQHVFVTAAAKIAANVNDVRFMMVGGATGDADRQYLGRLRNVVEEHGMIDRFIFTGERNDVQNFIAAADVVVHASVDPEPFGLVVIEAMAAAKPVIATNHGGPADIIENGVSGLLTTPGDDAELAEAIAFLLRSTDVRKEIGRNAKLRASEHFSFAGMTASLRSVLAQVAARQGVAL
jgi:glycosyltransferase involved in cell wall biosynthesis